MQLLTLLGNFKRLNYIITSDKKRVECTGHHRKAQCLDFVEQPVDVIKQEFHQKTRVEGKVQQLIGFLVQKDASEIGNDFAFRDEDPDRAEYFNTMIAEALTSFFNVPSGLSDVEPLNTVQDIVDRINNAE
ncbi:hypothetical protein B9Z55_022549 [Caenorhabditis nigoni]|nr:hypothetical protein B9Z55_022549 [Caenorhabditis nigoni]